MPKRLEKFCPRCGEDITDSYDPADPEHGMMHGEWYCDACEHLIEEEDG